MGGFISKDRLLGQVGDPLSHNLYAYVGNNPLTHVDPLGLYQAYEGDGGGFAGKNAALKSQPTRYLALSGENQKLKQTLATMSTTLGWVSAGASIIGFGLAAAAVAPAAVTLLGAISIAASVGGTAVTLYRWHKGYIYSRTAAFSLGTSALSAWFGVAGFKVDPIVKTHFWCPLSYTWPPLCWSGSRIGSQTRRSPRCWERLTKCRCSNCRMATLMFPVVTLSFAASSSMGIGPGLR